MPDFREKVALITGASSGIGSGAAIHFAKLGCSLSLTGRDLEKLEKVKQECFALNPSLTDKIIVTQGDLTQATAAENVVKQTIAHFGKLDFLVNSAGIVVSGPVIDSSVECYDKVMEINVRSVVIITKLCLPSLIKTKGSIVNVSSITGICSFPNVAYYCMSKGALDQFTKCLALEMAPNGVRVNSVNPGVIVTEAHKRSGMDDQQYEKFLEHSKATHALGRVGNVEEVAKSIAFLISDDASFSTGVLHRVDGGRGIMTPR